MASSVGVFQPHRSADPAVRVKHIEDFLCRFGAVPVSPAVQALAAKNVGNAGRSSGTGGNAPGSGGGGGGGTSSGVLAGDATGPLGNNVVAQASGAFSVLGGDLAVAAGLAFVTFTDTGGGTDRAALRPTFLDLTHRTTLTTVPGVGAAIDWTVPDDAAADQTVASVIGEITGVTAGALEATVGVVVKHQNQDVEVMRFRGQGGMAATNVGPTLALKSYIGGQAYCRGDMLIEGTGGTTGSITDAGTTNTVIPLVLQHLTTGSAAAGLGTELDFVNQNSLGATAVTGFIQSLYTGGVTGSENGSVIFGAIYGGARCEVARFRATGMAVVGGVGGQFFCRGDFLHSGQSLGFYNTSPITQPGAYTLAGSATRTFPTDPSSAYTGLASGVGGTPYAAVADLNTLRGVVSSLEGVVRQVVSDLSKSSGVGLNAT